jgi:hypothetical protein
VRALAGDALLFALGAWLALRAMAACYRVLDLWYRVRQEAPRLVAGLVVWLGAPCLLAAWLDGRERWALLLGMAAYAGFNLSLYRLRYLFLPRARAARSRSPA